MTNQHSPSLTHIVLYNIVISLAKSLTKSLVKTVFSARSLVVSLVTIISCYIIVTYAKWTPSGQAVTHSKQPLIERVMNG